MPPRRVSWPGPPKRASSPLPPSRASAPPPPRRVSFPPCPRTTSLPGPAQTRSSPAPASIRSVPVPPQMTSSWTVPRSRSSPAVPTMVAGWPRQVGGVPARARGASARAVPVTRHKTRRRPWRRPPEECTPASYPPGRLRAKGQTGVGSPVGHEGSEMTVRYERTGPVAVVTIDRPERRNAIDRATAEGLYRAWRDFDADPEARVGILTGANGVFCAGADLVAFNLEETAGGLAGDLPHERVQAHHRRRRRALRGRRPGTGAVVRPPGGRGRCGLRLLRAALRGAPGRRRDAAPAPHRRA